jgi:hypothetical protein
MLVSRTSHRKGGRNSKLIMNVLLKKQLTYVTLFFKKITVQYVDYGNTEEITIDKLKENPGEPFVPFARLCSLPVTSKEKNKWNPDAVSLLKAMVGEEIYFETLASQNDRIFINLGSKAENLTQFLIENNLADFFDPIKDTALKTSIEAVQDGAKKIGTGLVQVVLFLSPDDFFIQFKDSLPALDTIGELSILSMYGF